jgi:hypothetical protein
VCGGKVNDRPNNTCEEFADNKWTYMSTTMLNSVASFAMTAINYELFIFGGRDNKRTELNTVYTYEYKFTTGSTLQWSARAPMLVTAAEHAVVALHNDTILLCGGTQNGTVANQCFLYIPSKNKWNDAWPMKINRTGHALSLYKGIVYAYGGEKDKNETGTWLSSIEMLSLTGWRLLSYKMNQSDVVFFASVVLSEPVGSIWLFTTPAICIILLSAIVAVYAVLMLFRRQLAIQHVFIKDMEYQFVC